MNEHIDKEMLACKLFLILSLRSCVGYLPNMGK